MSPTSAPPTTTPYDDLLSLVREASLLSTTAGLLSWDQEAMMPSAGVEYRSRQLAQIAGMTHRMITDPRVGELLEACETDTELTADPVSDTAANLREIRRRYDRATKLPGDLVEERARTGAVAKHEWAEARKAADFSRFAPWLERNLALARRTAECYGWPSDGEPWDALADGYEPGMTARQIETVFTPLRDRLQGLVTELAAAPRRPSTAFREVELPVEQQRAFVRFVAEAIGFDFDRGRVDESTHPFCSGMHPGDVRMTTRFGPRDVGDALGSTMHESGHGIYEQGLPSAHADTPLGSAVSLGIHESQSRMWENQVGRSEAFWRWCYPKLRAFFGDAVAHLDFEDVYGGMNLVEPGFIRVEADEATYNLHIMIRFELERALMSGDLDAADVPTEWNSRYAEYLGIEVPDDARGCLQDIHWSMGAFGYFPTYTLGNLYCAQLFEKAQDEIPGLHEDFAEGDFSALKAWLNGNIHAHGSRFRPAELCERITGEPLSADPLLRHLEGKLRPLYGL